MDLGNRLDPSSSTGGSHPARQRIFGMLVQTADSVTVEPLFLHFEVRSEQELGRQLLDRKSDGFRGFGKAPVAHGPVSPAATGGKQLGWSPIVKATDVSCHCTIRSAGPFSGRHRFGAEP